MSRVKYLSVTRGQKVHIEQYPNFHKSGSIKGMKEKYYGKNGNYPSADRMQRYLQSI